MTSSPNKSPFEILINKINNGKQFDPIAPFGGKPITSNEIPDLIGKDDASSAYYVPLNFIIDGSVPLAFAHAAHILSTYEKLQENPKTYSDNYIKYIQKLKIILELSKKRNMRLMRKINIRLTQINNDLESNKKILHKVYPFNKKEHTSLLNTCVEYSIDPISYFDETNDEAEVNGCTNTFCLDQLNEAGKASDAIRIIIDENNKHWLILIVRAFAPGIGNMALAGGFLDTVLESKSDAADREFEEEVSGVTWLNSQFNIKFDLPVQNISEWDVRAKFAKDGMIVGGNAIIYFLNRSDKKNNSGSTCCIIA